MANKTNKNDNSSYQLHEDKLRKRSEAVIELLKQRGIIEDVKIEDEQVRKASREKKKVLFHNTQLMLRHYRDISWLLECFPDNVAAELDRPLHDLDALLSAIDAEMGLENKKLESRMESVHKSRLLLDRFNEALTVLKNKPGNGELMYKILYLTYIVPEKLSISEIRYRLGVCERHYYRMRTNAINILSLRLWATPAAQLDSWIEILALLESL